MLFILAPLFFVFFLILFGFLAKKFRLVDIPNHRKIHYGEVPLIGGLIIYFSIFLFSFFIETSSNMTNILLTSFILVFLGAIDDAKEIGITFRLVAQLICCLILVGSGLVINNMGDYMFLPNIEIGSLSILFTIFCVIGLTNSFNFIDGVDGLCSCLSLISILSIIFICVLNNKLQFLVDLKLLVFLCITIFFFIFFNITSFFKIFLGDSGSIFLGFIVAWILISTAQDKNELMHPVLAIWCVTLPVFDLTSVVIRRILRKINPFKPDRRHVHHILIELGFSKTNTFLIIIFFSIFLNFFGLIIFYVLGSFPALISYLLLLFLYVFLMINLSRMANSI